MESERDEDNGANVGAAKNRPRERVPPGRTPPRGGHRTVPAFPRRPPIDDEAPLNADDAHFLARRRRRGGGEQMPCEAASLCSALLGNPFDSRAPGRRDDGGKRKQREQNQRRV